MTYSPIGGRVKIVETVSGSVTSTKQFIGGEERDGSGNVTKQFFGRGEIVGSTKYYFCKDHLGSVLIMTDNSGVSVSDRSFDPYGRMMVLSETVAPDHAFAGMYFHARSGMNLTAFRAYQPAIGQWLSRDPAGSNGSGYADGDPINLVDPLGLRALTAGEKAFVRKYFGNCLDPDKINLNPISGDRSFSPGFDQIFLTEYAEDGLNLKDPGVAGDFAHELFHAYQFNTLGATTYYNVLIPTQILNTLHDLHISPYNPYTPPKNSSEFWLLLSPEAQAQYFGEAVATGKDPLGILKNFKKDCGCKW